jgi:hypothetical protein
VFFLAPLVAMLPQSALAALVIVYSFGLIKPISFMTFFVFAYRIFLGDRGFRGRRGRRRIKGIIVAIIVPGHWHTGSGPSVRLAPQAGTNVFRPQCRTSRRRVFGLLLLRPEGPIFFAMRLESQD